MQWAVFGVQSMYAICHLIWVEIIKRCEVGRVHSSSHNRLLLELLAVSSGFVVELDITVSAERALLDVLALFPHDVLDGDACVGEDLFTTISS